jgi:putative flippase GtrA
MARPVADLYAHVRHHGPELVKFGIVGGIGTIIDLGGAAVLHSVYHMGPLESKAISLTAATVLTYLGSRFWTFRHRENQPVHREAMLFIVLNLAGLVLAEVVIACVTYGLGLKGPLAYNAASIVGTGLGTVFRWYAYRKWVFLAPAQPPTPPYARWEPYPAYPDRSYPAYAYQAYAAAPVPAYPAYPDQGYPANPDPAYPAGNSRRVRLEDPFIPNGRVASPLVAAAAPAGWAFRPVRPAAAPAPAPAPAPAAAPVPGTHRAPGRHRRTR